MTTKTKRPAPDDLQLDEPTNGRIDTKAAREALAAEHRERADGCAKAVQALLEEHRCQMQVAMIATGSGNRFQIEFQPVD